MILRIVFDDTSWMGSMPAKPVRFTEKDLRRALRAADKEGKVIHAYEVVRNGTIRVFTAPPDKQNSELDQWLEGHPDAGQT